MIGKRDKFWGGFEKQTALKLRWRRAADCSRGGIQQPETHDYQQWTAVYVGSLAARMTSWWRPASERYRGARQCRHQLMVKILIGPVELYLLDIMRSQIVNYATVCCKLMLKCAVFNLDAKWSKISEIFLHSGNCSWFSWLIRVVCTSRTLLYGVV